MQAIGLELALIAVLVTVNGLLAMTEIAVVSSRKARLQQRAGEGDAGARAALRLAEEPTRFLSAVQIGITLVGILAGAFGGATVAAQIDAWLEDVPGFGPYSEAIGLGIVVLAITYLSLVVGELVPKRIGMSRPEAIAAAVARPMAWVAWLATPLVAVLSASTEGLLRLLRVRQADDTQVTEEEIRFLVAQGAEAGAIAPAERTLLERVLALADRRVGELMTPRVDMVWLDAQAPEGEVWERVLASGRSHLPVCDGDVDRVLGVVEARDLLARRARGEPTGVRAALRPPLFVPETLRALELLDRLKQPDAVAKLAVVIGEHGGVEGLVTLTDVLQAIVGDIPDPGGPDGHPAAAQASDGSWTVPGGMATDELAALLGVDPPADGGGYSTVGGAVMLRLGRIPAAGDRVAWGGHALEVHAMDGNRVVTVRVQPTNGAPSATRD